MTRLTIITFLLFGQNTFAQDLFIDSLYYGIPVDEDVKHTFYRLSNNPQFQISVIDTTGDVSSHPREDGDNISCLVLAKSCVPNKASEITYDKYRYPMLIDGKEKAGCIQRRSDLFFHYKTKDAAKSEFTKISNYLRSKLVKAQSSQEINFKLSGYAFYLAGMYECPVITVTINEDDKSVCITYY